jgi:hypothetical protein
MSDEIIHKIEALGTDLRTEMQAGFGAVQERLGSIEARLGTLEGRVDDLVELQKGTTESIDILVGHLVPRAATGGR